MKEPWVKRVEINEKVGISADFVTILEQCVGYRAECEKNARAFYLKRKCVCDKTQVRFTSNARAFDSKHKGVFGEFGKGNHDGLSGLAPVLQTSYIQVWNKYDTLVPHPAYIHFIKIPANPDNPSSGGPGKAGSSLPFCIFCARGLDALD